MRDMVELSSFCQRYLKCYLSCKISTNYINPSALWPTISKKKQISKDSPVAEIPTASTSTAWRDIILLVMTLLWSCSTLDIARSYIRVHQWITVIRFGTILHYVTYISLQQIYQWLLGIVQTLILAEGMRKKTTRSIRA